MVHVGRLGHDVALGDLVTSVDDVTLMMLVHHVTLSISWNDGARCHIGMWHLCIM